MEITGEIRVRAAEAFPVESVRTLDAVHLATVLEFARVFPDISVLSTDSRILANLEPLGLRPAPAVADPEGKTLRGLLEERRGGR
jgi:hypothetical protein